jgi:hypothetical protein
VSGSDGTAGVAGSFGTAGVTGSDGTAGTAGSAGVLGTSALTPLGAYGLVLISAGMDPFPSPDGARNIAPRARSSLRPWSGRRFGAGQ